MMIRAKADGKTVSLKFKIEKISQTKIPILQITSQFHNKNAV